MQNQKKRSTANKRNSPAHNISVYLFGNLKSFHYLERLNIWLGDI